LDFDALAGLADCHGTVDRAVTEGASFSLPLPLPLCVVMVASKSLSKLLANSQRDDLKMHPTETVTAWLVNHNCRRRSAGK